MAIKINLKEDKTDEKKSETKSIDPNLRQFDYIGIDAVLCQLERDVELTRLLRDLDEKRPFDDFETTAH